jgi:hypothetical protein
MNARLRRAGAGAALGLLVALAALALVSQPTVPFAMVQPLWMPGRSVSPLPGGSDVRDWARSAMQAIGREQRQGVLRTVLGPRAPRVVQLGVLQDHGRTVGATALLALPAPRHGVRAMGFTATVLRDVLVDVDLRTGRVVSVQPGPGSQTSSGPAGALPAAPLRSIASAPGRPSLVRLSPGGPSFAPYDGSRSVGPAGRDWPVSLIFAGHATIAKVKAALRTVGFTHRGGAEWLGYGTAGGPLAFDADQGLKTGCDANGTDVHVRLYAPPGGDHFTDPRFGSFVVATVHLDRGDGCGKPPRLYGFSEEAERRVAATVAQRLHWRVQRDRIPLGNSEPYRRDLAAPGHIWWSDGLATLISVP